MTINPYESPGPLYLPPPDDGADATLLKFDIELDDLLHFNVNHRRHSWTFQIQRYLLIGLASFGTLFISYMVIPGEDLFLVLIVSVVLGIAGGFLIDVILKWTTSAQLRSMLKEGDNTSLFGERELQLTDQGLYQTSEFQQSRFPYSRILRLEEVPDYVFIYINSLQAHIIPKKKLRSGDLEGFMAALRSYLREAS